MSQENEYPILEANYSPEHNELVVSANEFALKYLQDLLQKLIASETTHKHFHIDRHGGLEGNISSIIIVKKVIG